LDHLAIGDPCLLLHTPCVAAEPAVRPSPHDVTCDPSHTSHKAQRPQESALETPRCFCCITNPSTPIATHTNTQKVPKKPPQSILGHRTCPGRLAEHTGTAGFPGSIPCDILAPLWSSVTPMKLPAWQQHRPGPNPARLSLQTTLFQHSPWLSLAASPVQPV